MVNKQINKQIRSISNRSSLLLLIFFAIDVPLKALLRYVYNYAPYGSVWQNEKLIFLLMEVGNYAIIFPVVFLVYYKCLNRKNGLRLKDTFQKSRRSKGWLLKWTVIAVGVTQLLHYIMLPLLNMIFQKNLSGGISFAAINGKDDFLGWILYGVPCILCAPFFEELLFRATIFRNNEPMGQLFASVVTGVAFGLWHTNINQTFFAALMGVFLCLIYIKTRSIMSVMFVHFANNLLSCALTFVRAQLGTILSASDKEFMIEAMFDKQTGLAIALTLIILLTIGVMIAGLTMFIVELVKTKGRLGLSKGEFPYNARKKAFVFLSAPLTILLIVVLIVLSFAP